MPFSKQYKMSSSASYTNDAGISSIRAILSTLAGETIDSIIFFPIAFGGIISVPDLIALMVTQIILKSLYEIAVLPLTSLLVKKLKKVENCDVYDNDITYSILKFWD